MRFRALNLDEANLPHLQAHFTANELNDFAKILQDYRAKTQAKLTQNATAKAITHSETNIASNELAQFFRSLGFETQIAQSTNAQSTNSAIDLALLQNGAIKVIIEAKLPESLSKAKAQMFSAQNPNCKALHEAILYYLREVVDRQNFGVESIIITDFTRFFIFNYKEFERIFAKNAKIKDIFAKFKNDTSNFYAKAQGILDSLDDEICGVCVDLEQFAESSTLKIAHKSLENLYKIFNRDFLFGEFKQSNPLSPRFYNELLYILGLSEYNRSGKILIEPSKESLKGQNTLYHLITTQIDLRNLGDSKDIDFVMQFVILWLNRILFLKLIEANLVRFNDDKNLAFLNKSKLKDYQALSHLFFEVLAKKHTERKDSPLAYLPYLNSSLFERHKCEEMLDISMLDNEAEFFYYETTQVRKEGKKQVGRVNLLTYIFEFLDAFDFGGENCDEVIEQKELIKTNVLGLVFEKLNGYKEGSFYTPNFITSYMCRVSLEKVVLDKFNSANPKWNATNLNDLATLIRDEREKKDEFKGILREIRICDPAVGSGHFLVSVLCEMVRIYHYLRLSDELNEYDLKIDNDEIIVYVENNRIFEYKKPTKPNDNNQAIQKSLFHLKKSIIENNLFGVDINPNSVEICKLRLWIELLKNSYYLRDSSEGFSANLSDSIHQMQTLPNIDINIKCGNSLISRFRLDNSLPTTQNIKKQIDEYKNLVFAYKNADKAEVLKKMSKKDIETKIQSLKATFRISLKDPKTKKELERAIETHIKLYGMFMLDDESLLYGLDSGISNTFASANLSEAEQESAAISFAKIKLLRHKLDTATNGAEHKNALEWRFEFPEVLDKNGDFMGFDLIVGNPPYMQVPKNIYSIERFPYSEGKDIGKQNTYKVFIEQGYNLAKPNGEIWFVVQTSIMCDIGSKHTRELLLDNAQINQFVELPEKIKIFTKVNQGVCIVGFNKAKPRENHRFKISIDNNKESVKDNPIFEEILQSNIKKFYPTNFEIPLIKKGEMVIINKLKTIKSTLKDFIVDSAQGNINTIHLKRIQSKTKTGIYLMKGENIKRYAFADNFMNCIKSDEILKILDRNSKSHIIAMQGIHNINAKSRIHCTLLEANEAGKFVFLHSTKMLFVEHKNMAKYLIGLLNSRLLDWLFRKTSTNNNINIYELETLPIPKPNVKNKKIIDKVVKLVDKILELKAQAKDSTTLETQINNLVYQLYELDSHEIKIIESK